MFRYLQGLAAFGLVALTASTHAQAPTPQSAGLVLGVREVTAQAIAANPAVRIAGQRLVEAQAKLAEAVAQRRMQFTFSGAASGSHGQVAEPASVQTYGTVEGTVALLLPNGSRLSAVTAQAQGGVRAAQAGLDRARLDLANRAAIAYFDVLRTRDARDIAQENLAQAERQVKDTRKRVELGDLPPADVLKTQVPAAQARAALARAQYTALGAEQALNSLLARNLSASLNLAPYAAPTGAAIGRADAVALTLAHSPDIREAQANVDGAAAALQFARHTGDPEWSVQATHARTTDITAYSSLTTIGIGVTLPLSDGGVARQQAKQAEAQLEQARAALALAKQDAQVAAEQAFLDVEAAQANVSGTLETLRIAQESLTKARQSYVAGLSTTRDVLDAQLALAQARADANAAGYDLAAARAKLSQAIGKEPW